MLKHCPKFLTVCVLTLAILVSSVTCSQPAANTSQKPSSEGSKSEVAKTEPSKTESTNKTPIRVGQVIDLSGLTADHGDFQNKAAQLFVEETNAKGGILGRPLEVISRDGKASTPDAVNQARDLIYSENVDLMIGGTNTSYALAILDMANQAKKVLLSQDSSDDFVKQNYRYVFRVPYLISAMQAKAAAAYAVEKYPTKKRYYLIGHDMAFGRTVVGGFKQRIQELDPNVQIIGEAYVKPTETDYNPYITAILQAQPDVVFFAWQVGIPFFKQSAPYQLSQKVQLLSAYWGGVQDMMILSKDELPVGAVVGGPPWYGIKTPENDAFVAAFKKKHNIEPKPTAYFEYITLQVMAEAIKKAGTTDSDKLVQALEGLEVDTVLGKIKIRALDHQGTPPYWMGTVKWDDKLKFGVISDVLQFDTEKFLPTAAEVQKQRESK